MIITKTNLLYVFLMQIENNFVQKKHDADDHNHPHAPSTSAAPTKALLHRKLHKSSSIPSNETFTNTDAKTKRSKSSQVVKLGLK